MELALGGDLFNLIESEKGVEQDIAHFYFRQLINGIDFLHSQGVAHRDIKPENLLLDKNGNLKIGDFGMAALFRLEKTGQRRQCTTSCGSPPYVAPEVIGNHYDPDKADIWSCGIVLFVLLTGQMPWDEPTRLDQDFHNFLVHDGKLNVAPWDTIPLEALSLLRCILKLDISQRFTIANIRVHPWFTRSNPYLSDGPYEKCRDPNELATRLLMNLEIDLSETNTSLSDFSKNVTSSMPVDNHAIALTSFQGYASQQMRISSYDQKIGRREEDFLRMLSEDPVQIQFKKSLSGEGRIPVSLSQKDVNFKGMFYKRILTRFYTVMPLQTIIPMLGTAFHQLGITVQTPCDPMLFANSSKVIIPVKTPDRRRILLRGIVQCVKVADSEQFVEVSFIRAIGNHVEWRHLFKRIVLLCRDAVYIEDNQ